VRVEYWTAQYGSLGITQIQNVSVLGALAIEFVRIDEPLVFAYLTLFYPDFDLHDGVCHLLLCHQSS
jgi:hypothetical protein